MEKKIYIKPEAEQIIFYSEEELATMEATEGGNEGGTVTPGWSTPDADDGWM